MISSEDNSILFDFDGVIADTEQGRYNVYSDLLKDYGYDMGARCAIKDLAGLTGDGFLTKFFPEIDDDLKHTIIRKRQGLYMNNLDKYCIAYPGAIDTIKDLKSKGYILALTTANSTKASSILLNAVGALEFFDEILGREICENPITKVKDYSLVPKHMGKKTSECVVIEDSAVGVKGAHDAGFFCIAFERFPHPIITENADVIIYDYNDLRKLFNLNDIKL